MDSDNLRRYPIIAKVDHEKRKSDGEFLLKPMLEGDEGFDSRNKGEMYA